MKRNYYHICTDGLSKNLLYGDVDDYVCGMNDIPICLLKTSAEMLCFCLMPNHVHFVLIGTIEDCELFINEFKTRTSRRLRTKYLEVKILRHLGALINPIKSKDHLINAIAYVLRNPVAAKMDYTAANYPWSSCSLYFQGGTAVRHRVAQSNQYQKLRGTQSQGCQQCTSTTKNQSETMDWELWPRAERHLYTIGELGKAKASRLLGTKVEFPDNYKVTPDGYIYPGSYIKVEKVEDKFVTAQNFAYNLVFNNDGAFEIDSGLTALPSYKNDEIKSRILEICDELYGTDNFWSLDMDDKLRVGVQLRKRYRVTAKQFAKIAKIDPSLLRSLMR